MQETFHTENTEKKEDMEHTEKKRKDSGAVSFRYFLCGLLFLFVSVISVFNL